MKNKIFKSRFSDMKVEVYESGFIALTDADKRTFVLGKPPNARIDLILRAIDYCEENQEKTNMKNHKSERQRLSDEKISLCRKCNCMTKSIVSEDGTHFNCGKCGAIK